MNIITLLLQRLSLCALLVLLGFYSSFSQPLTLDVTHIPIDQLSIGDFDFQTGGSSHYFFSVSIAGAPRLVILQMMVDAQIPGLPLVNAIRCADGRPVETFPFQIPTTFTNLDLNPNSRINVKVRDDCSPNIDQRILDASLAGGKLPAGSYTFALNLIDPVTRQVIGNDQFVLDIRNVSRLDLLSPRDGEAVANAFPLFQWIFDGSRVELSVYERLPQHSSKEEAAQGTPHLCVVLENVRSFQYPSSTPPQACPGVVVRNLEPGKRYVWRARGLTVGSGGGGASINSEIWEFTVPIGAGQTTLAAGGGSPESIADQLQNIPGLDPQLLSRLISGNLQPTGMVLVNGVPMTMNEILAILNDLARNPDKIIDIQVVER